MGQGSAFFPILSVLYIAPIFYTFEKKIIVFYLLFLFSLFLLLTIIFLFTRKKVMKNQMQTYFVVITLFLLFLNNLVL